MKPSHGNAYRSHPHLRKQEEWDERIRRYPMRERTCIREGCETIFISTDPGNRMCYRCATRSEGLI